MAKLSEKLDSICCIFIRSNIIVPWRRYASKSASLGKKPLSQQLIIVGFCLCLVIWFSSEANTLKARAWEIDNNEQRLHSIMTKGPSVRPSVRLAVNATKKYTLINND